MVRKIGGLANSQKEKSHSKWHRFIVLPWQFASAASIAAELPAFRLRPEEPFRPFPVHPCILKRIYPHNSFLQGGDLPPCVFWMRIC